MKFSMFFLQRIVKRRSSFSVSRNPTSTYAKYLQEKHKGSCELRDLRYKQFPTILSDHREFMNYMQIISQGVRPSVSRHFEGRALFNEHPFCVCKIVSHIQYFLWNVRKFRKRGLWSLDRLKWDFRLSKVGV